jgi:hypothetical protein
MVRGKVALGSSGAVRNATAVVGQAIVALAWGPPTMAALVDIVQEGPHRHAASRPPGKPESSSPDDVTQGSTLGAAASKVTLETTSRPEKISCNAIA